MRFTRITFCMVLVGLASQFAGCGGDGGGSADTSTETIADPCAN